MLSEIEQKRMSSSEDAKARIVLVAMAFAALAAILSAITLFLKLHG